MKRLLLPLLAALALPTAVSANIDPEVYKLCIPATDFQGCVKAMTTKSTDIPSMRMIDGGVELSGNSCPIDFVYVGSGRCRNFVVNMKTNITVDAIALWTAGHVDRPIWNYYYKLDQGTKAIFDKNCPKREPFLYTQNSCDEKPSPPPLVEIKRILKIARAKKESTLKVWDKKLEKIYGVKNLATDAIRH